MLMERIDDTRPEHSTQQDADNNTQQGEGRIHEQASFLLNLVDRTSHHVLIEDVIDATGQDTEKEPGPKIVSFLAKIGIENPKLSSLPEEDVNPAGNERQQEIDPDLTDCHFRFYRGC